MQRLEALLFDLEGTLLDSLSLKSQVYPFVQPMLETYQRRKVKMAICTNKSEAATRRQLEKLGLLPFFDFIAGGDTFPVRKPHAGHVLGVLEALKVAPAHAVFVGDTTNDVLACHGAGVSCILITHSPERQSGAFMGVEGVIREFDELDACLNEAGWEV